MPALQLISQDLFDKVRSRFENLQMGDSDGAVTIDPAQARFFEFDFVMENVDLGRVSISINDGGLKVYYSKGITENKDDIAKQVWYAFLKEMRMFAMRRLLTFDTRDIAKRNLDKNDYAHLVTKANKEQGNNMNESRWNHKRQSSKTSRAVSGKTEVIVRHHAPVEETYAGARSKRKNIKAIFIQNKDGERFKYPFIHTAGAFAMAQHVDHGGVPHDPAGKAIIRMSEDIAKLCEFHKQVHGTSLHTNDHTREITERTSQQLQHLRSKVESLGKRHHYENWIAEFNESPLMGEEMSELDEVTMEEYKSKFTETNFKEDLAQYFPMIHRIMQEANAVDLEEYVEEGHTVVPDINRERYTDLSHEGLEGPFRSKNGHIVYYDPKVGKYYNRDSDMYIGHDEWDEMNRESRNAAFEEFEMWAEDVEQNKLTDDQIAALQEKLPELEKSGWGPDGSFPVPFFQELGIDSQDLEDELRSEWDKQGYSDSKLPVDVFKDWLKTIYNPEEYTGVLGELGLAVQAQQQQQPTAESSAGIATVHGIMPANEVDDGFPNSAMEKYVMDEKDDPHHGVVKAVKEFILSRYNADNGEVGPFMASENIITDAIKQATEKYGDQVSEYARSVAEKLIKQMTNEWEKKHHKRVEELAPHDQQEQGENKMFGLDERMKNNEYEITFADLAPWPWLQKLIQDRKITFPKNAEDLADQFTEMGRDPALATKLADKIFGEIKPSHGMSSHSDTDFGDEPEDMIEPDMPEFDSDEDDAELARIRHLAGR
jgi:hypothetical protein